MGTSGNCGGCPDQTPALPNEGLGMGDDTENCAYAPDHIAGGRTVNATGNTVCMGCGKEFPTGEAVAVVDEVPTYEWLTDEAFNALSADEQMTQLYAALRVHNTSLNTIGSMLNWFADGAGRVFEFVDYVKAANLQPLDMVKLLMSGGFKRG